MNEQKEDVAERQDFFIARAEDGNEDALAELDEKECCIWSESNKTFFDAHRASHNCKY